MANFPTSISTDANLYIAVTGLQTTLAVAVGTGDATLTLTSTSGFPSTGMVTVDNNEVVAYTGISGADLTGCTRGADGTTAFSHAIGVTVGLTVVAAHHNRLKDEIIAVESALGASFTKGNLSEATSSVLTVSGGTNSVIGSGTTIEVKQASAGQSGYLSSTDWSAFNGKQNTITTGNLSAGSSKLSVSGGTGAVIGSGASVDLGTVALDDLSNVTVPSPTTNDILAWNGSAWVNAAAPAASLPLAGGTMTGDITMSNQKAVVFKETTGNGTDSVTLKAPASVTTSYTLQLPPAVASAPGQVLTDVNANGVLTWEGAVGATVSREDYVVGTALNNYTGSTTVFNLVTPFTVAGKTLLVTLDGDVQTLGATVDYLETNSTTVTFNNALVAGERVSFISSVPAASSSGIVNSGTTGQLAYYASNAATVTGTNAATVGTNGNLIVTGTTTNDNAAAGKIGEYVEASVGNTNAPSNPDWGDLTSISLTAGDWDVHGFMVWQSNGATWTNNRGGIGTVSGNTTTGMTSGRDRGLFANAATSTVNVSYTHNYYRRISIASTSTIYLKYECEYSAGTPVATGSIMARRVR